MRQTGRNLITSLNHIHRQGSKPDILILSSPRSGSTWLMESFYTQPGTKFLNVPMEKIYLQFLRVYPRPRNFYPSLTQEDKRIFKRYLAKDRPIRHCGPLNIFEKDFNFFTNRRVLKIHKFTPLIEWLADELDFEIIYLIRHPIPQSLSAKRRGFLDRINDFLSDEIFVEKYLSPKQRIVAEEIQENGSALERYITSWCLENLVASKIPKNQRRWISISYEELVTKPFACFAFLGRRLEFEHIEGMLSRLNIPSRESSTSLDEKVRRIQTRDTAYLVNGWVKEVGEAEIARSMDVLELFDIHVYRADRFFPDDDFLLFPEEELFLQTAQV
jgi:hypothetical protein